jgi:hypothetical protein
MPLPRSPFDPAQSIYAGLSIVQLKILPQLTSVTGATDTLTKTAHGLQVGQIVQYVSGTGFTGLAAATNYFVVFADANTFKLSATKGGTAISVGTSSAGVFQPVSVFEAQQLDDDPEQEVKYLDRPDITGELHHARSVVIKGFEKWTFGLDEVKRLLEIFSGSLRGRKTATCTLWIPDPDDASGKCSLVSETDFSCVVTRDGKISHGAGDFSKTSIKIESMKVGNLTWTKDATV